MAAKRVWEFAEDVVPSQALLDFLHGDPLIARLLTRRGIETPEAARQFLYPDQYPVTPPEELPDLAAARDRVIEAIQNNENIGIWGDFDVDGQTSTSLLVGALTALGNAPVYYIPHRKKDGHGIAMPALKQFLDQNPISLLITCDTGIAEHEAVDYANSRGIEVIITDHHNLPQDLPNALACVNPERVPADHPLHHMTGVGAAYKLIEAVCRELGKPEIAEAQLDLVALGTVADVGLLCDENRYLVQRGLEVIRRGERLGLKTLLTTARTSPSSFNAEGISFTIAPRMNSLGRLSNANQMVELLTTNQPGRAEQIAVTLEGLNTQRKEVQNRIRKEAFALLENHPQWADYSVIILHKRDWESGVVGIVANSIVERYGRPAILLTGERSDGSCFGSARSLEGVPLIDIINANQPLIEGAGHTMAAGAWLKIEDIEKARRALHETTQVMLPDGLPPFLQPIEMQLQFDEINEAFIENLERLEPFGAGNPKPVFSTANVTVHSSLIFGRDETHRKVTLEDENGALLSLTWWNGAEFDLPEGAFDIAYTVQTSTYRGVRSMQVLWVDAQQRETQKIVKEVRPSLQITDLRHGGISEEQLKNAMLWREGEIAATIKGRSRLEVSPAAKVALYSIPASTSILRSLLETSKAEELLLILKNNSQDDDMAEFVNRLAGMVNYAISHQGGWLPYARLAAALNQRDAVVFKGLELLESLGQITILEEGEEGMFVKSGGHRADSRAIQKAQKALAFHLKETASFRNFVKKAPAAWFAQLIED